MELATTEVVIERGRLRLFAQATGQTDPVFTDLAAARAAGFRDLPAPPTFLTSLELGVPDPYAYLIELGIDLGGVLHGEQSFVYHAQAYAGDILVLRPRIVDVYEKRGGALEFLVRETLVSNEAGAVAELRSVLAIRGSGEK